MLKIITVILIYIFLLSTKVSNYRFGNCGYKIRKKDILDTEINGFFKMFNPSITRHKEGYILCSRYSNRTMKNLLSYFYGKLYSESHIMLTFLDSNMKIQKIIAPNFNNIYSLEDPRICIYNDIVLISATEFKDEKNIYPVLYTQGDTLEKITYTGYHSKSKIQKNWCPFSHEGSVYLHTDTYPYWYVYKINPKTGEMNQISKTYTEKFFRNIKKDFGTKLIRCSTSWKSFTEYTFLCGIHIKQFSGILPTIRTILVEVDKRTFQPIRKTSVLCLDKENSRIQFLSGLEVDDTHIYLSYGIGDYKTVVSKIFRTDLILA